MNLRKHQLNLMISKVFHTHYSFMYVQFTYFITRRAKIMETIRPRKKHINIVYVLSISRLYHLQKKSEKERNRLNPSNLN